MDGYNRITDMYRPVPTEPTIAVTDGEPIKAPPYTPPKLVGSDARIERKKWAVIDSRTTAVTYQINTRDRRAKYLTIFTSLAVNVFDYTGIEYRYSVSSQSNGVSIPMPVDGVTIVIPSSCSVSIIGHDYEELL